MFATNQESSTKSIGYVLRDLAGAFLVRHVHADRRLNVFTVVRWLQDERRRRAAIRELNRLNDYYLNDIGISRDDIDAIVDKSLRERQNGA
jgi:uncharacterized protein YjiS (DUF1127 family)